MKKLVRLMGVFGNWQVEGLGALGSHCKCCGFCAHLHPQDISASYTRHAKVSNLQIVLQLLQQLQLLQLLQTQKSSKKISWTRKRETKLKQCLAIHQNVLRPEAWAQDKSVPCNASPK